MNKILLIMILFLLIPSFLYGQSAKAKITVKVLSESRQPLEGAKVEGHFVHNRGLSIKKKEGISDKDGYFIASHSSTGVVGASAKKTGYYKSGEQFLFENSEKYLFYKRWLPWNPTIEIVLREKRNPVKMYRKCTGYIKVPVENEPLGYDVVKGDWVAPYGKGEVKDFVFIYKSRYTSYLDWEGSYKVFFPNPGDGFQEYNPSSEIDSEFKWPYEAPVEGYDIKEFSRYSKYYNNNTFDPLAKSSFTNLKKKQRYIFRVRTEYNSNGDIVGGLYGRKMGDFSIAEEGSLSICYSLNPKGRSLEYGGNLFEDEDY